MPQLHLTKPSLKALDEQAQNKTMKALIGIDPEARYNRAVSLLSRLGFKGCEATLLSVVEPMIMPMAYQAGPVLGPAYDFDLLKEIDEARAQAANKALMACEDRLEAEGIKSESVLKHGFPAGELLQAAEELRADLIVTAATHQGVLSCALLNSVSRAAVISAHQSVLIAKNDLEEGVPLSAVLAVDHSEYCLQGIAKLMEMNPVGFRKITVLTALDGGFSENRLPIPNLNSFGIKAEAWREEMLQAKCYEICDKLWNLRIKAEPLLIGSEPVNAIENAMASTQSQLLIMAAHGHGFLQRAMLGSLSLHEAVAERHSLLILRP